MATASITRKTNHSHSAPSNPCSAERLDLLLLGLWGFALPCFSIPTGKEWIPADQHNPAFHTFPGNHIQREHLPLRSLFQGVSFTEHPKCPVVCCYFSAFADHYRWEYWWSSAEHPLQPLSHWGNTEFTKKRHQDETPKAAPAPIHRAAAFQHQHRESQQTPPTQSQGHRGVKSPRLWAGQALHWSVTNQHSPTGWCR